MQRSTAHLALTLLLAAALGVSATSAAGRGQSAAKKPAAKKAAQSTKSGTSGTSTARKGTAKSHGKSKKNSRRTKGQQAPTSDRISEIQQALAKDGSFSGEPTGKWDDSTVAAMKKFQEAHGLTPSGKLDAHTLQQLGLGSQITGVAAPMPPVSSSSLSSSTSSQAAPQGAPQR